MSFQKVKGMQDWYPAEKAVQRAVFDVLRTTALRFGFQEVEAPAIETLSLLTAKSGEEVKDQIFVLEKKGAEELGLRFDLTVPFTRMLVQKLQELPKPIKWFGLGRMWRYEAPQKGRLREFDQLSIELFGAPTAEADAECISLLVACLKNFGIQEKDFVVCLNNRKLLEGLLRDITSEEKVPALVRLVDKSAKITVQELDTELFKLDLSDEQAQKVKNILTLKGKPVEVISRLQTVRLNDIAKEGLAELQALVGLLDMNCLSVDLSIARGFDYYTGTIFECRDTQGELRALAGGGRYDNLVQLFGGQPTPAVGFGIGTVTLILLLEERGLLPKPQMSPEYCVIAVTDTVRSEARAITARLRRKTTVETDLMNRKLAKQLEYANTIGAQKAVIVGQQELAQNKVRIKDLKTGKEELVRIEEL